MKISTGKSRRDTFWENKNMTWEEFCERVKNTTRTDETYEEYKKLPKEEQNNIKDVGGFVAGHLKNGKRKKNHVICRSMLTLDMDYGRENIWQEIKLLYDFKCCLYSTHKHCSQKPRFRLIIPLKRDVDESEYEVVCKMVACEIGEELFDKTTYEASRLMYWPSTSKDGEFVFEQKEGVLLDVDFYLKKQEKENLKSRNNNMSIISSSTNLNNNNLILNKNNNLNNNNLTLNNNTPNIYVEIENLIKKKKEDPLKKENIIGTFCRTYTINEAIKKYLPHVYAPSKIIGRYDYIPASSVAGLVIYENKFAYSHHASDPACGKLLNAYELVAIHMNKNMKPSGEMMKFVLQDEKVKCKYVKEKLSQAKKDFNVEKSWYSKLQIDKNGRILETLDNFILIIENDENLKNIVYSLHTNSLEVRGNLPWKQIKHGWNETDNASLRSYIYKNYNVYSPKKTNDALLSVITNRTYHPIKDYLNNLPPWDKIPRVNNLLIDYLGAEDTSYTKSVMRKTLVAAIARIYNPGVKFDHVLILNGPQGVGKSTFFSKLAGEWFSDSLTIADMKDKSACEKLQGYWILELGELAGIRKMEVEIIKSFLSRSDDKYRPSYGATVENHPRQCIIVGSTNAETGFLRDITGNRRFWPVRISKNSKLKSWNLTKNEVKQIWAEALEFYKKGEKLILEEDEEKTACVEQTNAMESDERTGLVMSYLEKPLPKNWDEMNINERRDYINGRGFLPKGMDMEKRKIVCNMEIWCECFGNEPSKLKISDSHAISSIMKKISGWDKYSKNKAGVKKRPIYGNQRCYERLV